MRGLKSKGAPARFFGRGARNTPPAMIGAAATTKATLISVERLASGCAGLKCLAGAIFRFEGTCGGSAGDIPENDGHLRQQTEFDGCDPASGAAGDV